MGREVRMIPPGWEHPKKPDGRYKPLFDGDTFAARLSSWDAGNAAWSKGLVDAYDPPRTLETIPEKYRSMTYAEYAGERPDPDDYMLVGVPASERTLFMMYEDTSEGTPKSPAFESPEELARWLADTGASAFAYQGATYEQWLDTIRRGFAPSMIISAAGVESGVAGLAPRDPNEKE